MSPDVIAWTLALTVSAPLAQGADRCAAAAQRVNAEVEAAVAHGDHQEAERRALGGDEPSGECAALRVMSRAWQGWNAAVAAADRGGTPEALRPVQEAIAAVTALGPPRSAAAYAAALLRAAAAAAQDERDEMRLWLEEARAIAERLALAGPAPTVPLAIDAAEGALWHSVDDYELAEAAYARALATADTPAGWRGLARARERRGNRAGTCDAYQHVAAALAGTEAAGGMLAEARAYLVDCQP